MIEVILAISEFIHQRQMALLTSGKWQCALL